MPQWIKNLPAMQEVSQETGIRSLGWEDLLEGGMAVYSGVLAWRIPWTEEPSGLQSTGLQRVRHNWSDWAGTRILYWLPWWLSGKESACQETRVWSLGQEDPLEKEMATHSSIPGKSHGQRSLAGYSPWGKKSQIQLSNSVQFSCSVMSNSLRPHEPQHARPPCPSPTPGVYPNSCPSSRWCHPTISSSVDPFSSYLQSFLSPGYFQMSQLFTLGSQSIGVSASLLILPMNIQDWFPLGWTGWVSLQSEGLSRVFSNTTVQKNQLFGAQLSL